MSKKIVNIILFMGVFLLMKPLAKAQQSLSFSQYMLNGQLINPAYAGCKGDWSVSAFYRAQWLDFEGAPIGFSIGTQGLTGKKVGLGLSFQSDKIGPIQQIKLDVQYAYHFDVGDGKFSMGLQASMLHYQANYLSLETIQQGDEAFGENINRFLPNFGVGWMYYGSKWMLGLSIPNLLSNRLSNTGTVAQASRLERIYVVHGALLFSMGKDWELKPYSLLRYVHKQNPILDLNMMLMWREQIGWGVGYRSSKVWNIGAYYHLNSQLNLGYLYEHSNNNNGDLLGASHEVIIEYVFRQKRNIMTPRYF